MVSPANAGALRAYTGGDRLDSMSQFSLTIGWISIGLSVWFLVLATVAGAMAYFVILIAIMTGGFSSIAIAASEKFAVAKALLGTVMVFSMTHHVACTAFKQSEGNPRATIFSSIPIPIPIPIPIRILVSVAMTNWGFHRHEVFQTSSSEYREWLRPLLAGSWHPAIGSAHVNHPDSKGYGRRNTSGGD